VHRVRMQGTALRDTAPTAADANDEQVTVRIPAHLLDRIDKQRHDMAEKSPGVAIKRSDVLRACILRGLDALENDR